MENEKQFFHLAPQEDIDRMLQSNTAWGELNEIYKQPDWCNYPNAISRLGCWSLVDMTHNGLRTKISEGFCSDCPLSDMFKNKQP